MNKYLLIPISVYICVVGSWILFNGHIPTSDAANYVCGAQNMLDGYGYSSYDRFVENGGNELSLTKRFPIGFPFFIAVTALITQTSAYNAACILNFFLGAASVVLLFYLVLPYTTPLWAMLLSTVWASATWLMSPVISLWSEPIAICLIMLSTLLYLRNHYFYAALFAGIAYTTRHTMSAFCIALAIDAFLRNRKAILPIIFGGVIGGGGIIIYNLVTFDTICPYHGPPSTYTFIEHLQTAVLNFFKIFTPLILLAYRPKNIPRLVYIFLITFTIITLYGVNKYQTSPLHYRLLLPAFWCVFMVIASQLNRRGVKIFVIILILYNLLYIFHWWNTHSKNYPRPYIEEPHLPAVSEDHSYLRAKYNYNIQFKYSPDPEKPNRWALENGKISTILHYKDIEAAESADE